MEFHRNNTTKKSIQLHSYLKKIVESFLKRVINFILKQEKKIKLKADKFFPWTDVLRNIKKYFFLKRNVGEICHGLGVNSRLLK